MSTVETKKSSKSNTSNAAKSRALKVVDTPAVEGLLDPINQATDSGNVIDLDVLIASKFEDDSTINAERKDNIVNGLDMARGALPSMNAALQTLEDTSNRIARAELVARGSILLKGGLYPDWAGNSTAWVHAWTRPFGAAMLENKITKERRDRIGGNVRKFRTDNNLTVAYVADYVLRSNNKLAAEKVKVNGKGAMITLRKMVDDAIAGAYDGTSGEGEDKASNNATIPAILRKEIVKHYNAQRKTDGAILDNFKTVPRKFGKGGNKAESGRQTPRERVIANHNTYTGQLVKALTASAKDAKGAQKSGELASDFVANELLTLASAHVLAIFGEDGEKLNDNSQRRTEVNAALEQTINLLNAAFDYGNEEGDWDTVTSHLAKNEQ